SPVRFSERQRSPLAVSLRRSYAFKQNGSRIGRGQGLQHTARLSSPMRSVLGISAFYHDSAAALVIDGEIVAAAQEERFTRIKHDHRFPQHAVDYCLDAGGLKANDLDAVVFYEKPFLKFERLMESYISA